VAELKTKQNDDSVETFLNTIVDEQRRADCQVILDLMKQATGEEAKMWGAAIIGFGKYHYKYASGHEGDSSRVGFSPRKKDYTLYLGYACLANEPLMSRLGKHKTGKGCLYIKKLSDIDLAVLRELVQLAYAHRAAMDVSGA